MKEAIERKAKEKKEIEEENEKEFALVVDL